MSQIFNKSSHPVAIKRIPIRIWALRDEIEAALDRRIKECEAAGSALYLDDIKEFYGMRTDKPLAGQPQLQLVTPTPEAASASVEANVDEMMQALSEASPVPQETESAAAEAQAQPASTGEEVPAAASTEVVQKADELIAAQTPAEKSQGPAEHLRRPYQRECPDSDKISYGFALLSDLNMDWMLAFSKEKFTQGQSVVIEFLIPRSFSVSAEILLCHNYAMRSRIISESKPDYRLQCRFTYSFAGERARLREFLTSVEPSLPKRVVPKTQPTEDAGPEA